MPLTHSQIWSAIDALALRAGTTPSGLARLAGLDATAFNRSKRISSEPTPRPRWPSTESLAKLMDATNTSFSDFASLAEGHGNNRGIPLIGFAQAGGDGYFDDSGFPVGFGWDEITLPHTGEDLYALEISGDSMLPVYRDGDRILVDPHGSNFRKGDRLVVKTEEGEIMAKELARLTTTVIELKSLNASYPDRTLELSQITWMARIVWASQ